MRADDALEPMPDPMPRSRISTTAVLVAGVMAALIAISAPAALADTKPVATFKFSLDKGDERALKASQRASDLRDRSAKVRSQMDDETRRILMIEELLAESAGDEAVLRAALQARMIEQYKGGGDTADWAFLLSADGVGEAIDRANLVQDINDRDASLAAAHAMSVQRMEDLRAALTELRDVHGEQAAALEDHALDLDAQLVAARDEDIDRGTDIAKGAGAKGTWYVMPGGSSQQMFLPFGGIGGAAYDGGTRTPARPATAGQITRVLSDPRIDIYAGGRVDIATGRIDGRLLDALTALADSFGSVIVTSLQTGHGVYTASGNVSEHAFGCAADIGSLSGIRIEPSTQGPGSITERGVLLLAGLQGDLAPHQVISLNSYGGPTLAMGDHGDHIHLGYSC